MLGPGQEEDRYRDEKRGGRVFDWLKEKYYDPS